MKVNDTIPALRAAYLVLLDIPVESPSRTRLQPVLAMLRDEIARMTGREAEDVQNEHERIAAMSLQEKLRVLNGDRDDHRQAKEG